MSWFTALRNAIGHFAGVHTRCSIYDRCRSADLEADFEAFKRAIENPATRDATAAATLYAIANGPTYAHLTYDPFTFKSRRF